MLVLRFAVVSILCAATALVACSGDIRFDDPDDTDAGGGADAGGGDAAGDAPVVDPGTNCGDGGICQPGAEFCCATSNGFSCMPTGQACAGIAIACDDSFVCPTGRVCCAVLDLTGLHEVECHLPERCGSGIALCDPFNPQCPSGQTCAPTTLAGLPPGYSACR